MIAYTKGKGLDWGRNPVEEVPLKRHRTHPRENIKAGRLGEKGSSGAVLVMVKNRVDTQKCTSGRVLKPQTASGVVAAREKRPKSCLCSVFMYIMPQNTR